MDIRETVQNNEAGVNTKTQATTHTGTRSKRKINRRNTTKGLIISRMNNDWVS